MLSLHGSFDMEKYLVSYIPVHKAASNKHEPSQQSYYKHWAIFSSLNFSSACSLPLPGPPENKLELIPRCWSESALEAFPAPQVCEATSFPVLQRAVHTLA